LWLLDAERGTTVRFTTDGVGSADPRWSPDGERVAYISFRKSFAEIYQRFASGAPREECLLTSPDPKDCDCWSPDGKELLFTVEKPNSSDLLRLDVAGKRETTPLDASGLEKHSARISPDGRWLAFSSFESGRPEVCIAAYPAASSKHQVSLDGGISPKWRADGKELYFQDLGEAAIFASAIGDDPIAPASAPKELFRVAGGHSYAPAPGGDRFLLKISAEDFMTAPVTVILDWPGALR
jgi:Tol biopolymer transport system component